jgi:hypothetical protein
MRALVGRSGARCSAVGVCARVTSIILIAALLSGCRAHLRVAIPAASPPQVQHAGTVEPGDHVRVKLRSGATMSFEVAEVRPDVLVGTQGEQVRYDAMAQLDRSTFSPVRTIILVGGALALLVMTLTAAAYASLAGGL